MPKLQITSMSHASLLPNQIQWRWLQIRLHVHNTTILLPGFRQASSEDRHPRQNSKCISLKHQTKDSLRKRRMRSHATTSPPHTCSLPDPGRDLHIKQQIKKTQNSKLNISKQSQRSNNYSTSSS